jgi:hypothetical protein
MTHTIREHVKRRMWWCVGTAVGGWLTIFAGTTLEKDLPGDIPRGVLPLVGFVLFFGAILAMNWLVKCPKCKAKIGRTIAMPLTFSWGSGPKINYCPYCGVNLDEPMPQTGPQAGNPIHPA